MVKETVTEDVYHFLHLDYIYSRDVSISQIMGLDCGHLQIAQK